MPLEKPLKNSNHLRAFIVSGLVVRLHLGVLPLELCQAALAAAITAVLTLTLAAWDLSAQQDFDGVKIDTIEVSDGVYTAKMSRKES